jgi:hypothetical protein
MDGVKDMLFKIARMLRRWMLLMRIEEVIVQLEVKALSPPQLTWCSQENSLLGLAQLDTLLLNSSVAVPSQQFTEEAYAVYDQTVLAGRNALSNSVMSS